MRRVWLAWALAGCACPSGLEVRVEDYSFCARLAETEAERRAGLRGAAPLAPGEALLLVFPVEDELCVVNDGVDFPLDVLWADASGRVIAIERSVPADDGTLRCHGPARDVLEVAAGELDGVGPGASLSR